MLLCNEIAHGSRLNQENFDKIKIHDGMAQKEVRDILGEPADASGGSFLGLSSENATGRDKKTIVVQFLDDKVASKHISAGGQEN